MNSMIHIAAVSFVLSVTALAVSFDHNHPLYDQIVKQYVKEGKVDYRALKDSPGDLTRYLGEAAEVSRSDFDAWAEDEQLALLINVYNAATLKLIIDYYPVTSIKKIGSLFKGPWDQPVVRLWGDTITLNNLEHDIIRKRYPHVPEIHFALVCAAMGCPPLRSEAFVPSRLKEQLADQRKMFLSQSEKNNFDANAKRLNLSPIFKWYGGDFEKHTGSVQVYLKAHWPSIDDSFSIRYTTYDWSLNEQ